MKEKKDLQSSRLENILHQVTCSRKLKEERKEKQSGSRKFGDQLTLIGTHGNSGKALATALAPASFVKSEMPTKNSLPVNNTSPPSSFAFGSAISTNAKSSSFFRIARVFST